LSGADRSAGRQDLERDTRFGGLADQLAHPGAMFAQVYLSQWGIAKPSLEFLSPTAEIIQGRHVVVDVPTLVLGDLEEARVVDRQPDEDARVPDPLQEIP